MRWLLQQSVKFKPSDNVSKHIFEFLWSQITTKMIWFKYEVQIIYYFYIFIYFVVKGNLSKFKLAGQFGQMIK